MNLYRITSYEVDPKETTCRIIRADSFTEAAGCIRGTIVSITWLRGTSIIQADDKWDMPPYWACVSEVADQKSIKSIVIAPTLRLALTMLEEEMGEDTTRSVKPDAALEYINVGSEQLTIQ